MAEPTTEQSPFGDLFTHNPEPMWIFDLETWRFLEVNVATVRRYGYSREELLGGMTVADIRSPEEWTRMRRDLPRARAEFQEVGIYQHRTRSGETVDMDIATYPMTYQGRPARLVRAIDVASKRDRHWVPSGAQNKGAATSESIESAAIQLLEAVGDHVAKLDAQWKFVDANRVVENAFGISKAELRNRSLWEVAPLLLGTSFESKLREAMISRRPVHFTARGPRSLRWFEIRAYPSGEGLSIIMRDISDRMRAESRSDELQAQLHRVQRMETLGELVSGISHDFNNLLTIMAGSVHRLKALQFRDDSAAAPVDDESRTRHGEAVASSLVRLEQALDRASSLSRRLLSFSRNKPADFVKTDINRCVEQTISLLSESSDRRIEFTTALDSSCHYVRGDAHQLEHVFMNLMINARDALVARLARSSHGRIHVKSWRGVIPEDLAKGEELDPESEYLCLLFEDNGEGIPEDVRSRVFDPFFTTKSRDRGTGLGLSISREAVRDHGGAITVESVPGEGTRFLLHLPIYESRPIARATAIESRPRARVLVVEDEESLRELLEEILAPLGYEVVLAEDGRRGVDLFSGDPGGFDAVLLDLNMPGINGAAAFRSMRSIRPSTKILMMTGSGNEQMLKELGEHRPENVLCKPYKASELQERLAALLLSSLN